MKFLTDLATKLRMIFGGLPTGFEPFELDDGTEVVDGLVVPKVRCYPLRKLEDGRKPTITSRHFVHNKERKNHNGVDFFYPWRDGDKPIKIGDGGRTKNWAIPNPTYAIAAASGIVTIAGPSKTGHRAWIQIAGGLYVGYFHLTRLFVKPGEAVGMGAVIGIVGDNPIDNDAVHLHFEVYKGDLKKYRAGTVDPERFLKGARMYNSLPSHTYSV